MPVWINEFHYDNGGVDVGEFVEIAGTAGTDLTGWTIVLYNGNGGVTHDTDTLSGSIPNQGGTGFGTVSISYPVNGIENDIEGIALVNSSGVVVEFISYEGTVLATNGPANGMTSTDVGVDEDPTPAVGTSIGRIGTGGQASNFTWAVIADDTPGAVNNGQTFANSAPAISNLDGDNVGWTEGGGAVLLDFDGDLGVTDADSADFSGGTLTISISENGVGAEDVLFVDTSGTVTVSGSNVLVGGDIVGTYAGGTGGSPLVISFTTAFATPAAVQTLMRALTYDNLNDTNPNTAQREIEYALTDGDGGSSPLLHSLVSISSTNDDPVIGGDTSGSVTEDGTTTDSGTLTISDPDGPGDEAFVEILAGTAGDNGYGTFEVSTTGAWTYTLDNGDAAVQALDDGQTLTDTITVFSEDGTEQVLTITINGADEPIVGPPTVDLDGVADGTGYAGAYTEGGVGSPVGSGIVVTSTLPVTGATITITDAIAGDQLNVSGSLPDGITVLSGAGTATLTLGGTGTAAEWEDALELVRYTALNDNPDAFGTDTARSINVTVSDGVTPSAPATATIAITPVNNDPVLINLSGNSVTFTEGSAFVLLDDGSDAQLSDVDNDHFAGGRVSFGMLSGALPEDSVIVTATGNVSVSGSDVLVNGIQIGTIAANGPGEMLRIEFDADATPAAVQELLRAIAYTNSGGDDPTAGARSIAYILTDGDGGATGGGVTVNVSPENDGPVLTASAGITAFVEGSDVPSVPVVIDPGITISDPDSNIFNATIQITTGTGTDVLAFVNDNATLYGNITQVNATGGSVVQLESEFASATFEQWQNALRSITYTSSSEDPIATDRVVTFSATDGTDFSNSVTKTISVLPVNDSPSGTSVTITIDEDQLVTLSQASFGYSDPENHQFRNIIFTGVTGGTLYYDGDEVGGTDQVAVTTFPASYDTFELDLGHLSFRPDANSNGLGAASISFQVQDGFGVDNGGHDTDATPDTITYDVDAVNDEPDLSAPTSATVTFTEAGPATALFGGTNVTDPDNPIDYTSGGFTLSIDGSGGALDFLPGSRFVAQGADPFDLYDTQTGEVIGVITGLGTQTVTVSSFDEDATQEAVDALLQSFGFHFNGFFTSPSSRTATLNFNDGGNTGSGGALDDQQTQTVNLAPLPVHLYDDSDTLVGAFSTIQAAINAASDGYRITAAAGTYNENLVFSFNVKFEGENVGRAGDESGRGPETIIAGSVTIAADGVTIDGARITGDSAGPLGSTGVIVNSGANDFSLINSILSSAAAGDFAIFVGLVSGLDIGHNLIEGYSIGMYIAGGNTAGSVHDNLFQGDGGPLTGLGNGVNSETTHVTITGNTFDGIYGGSLNLYPFGPDSIDLDSYISGNTITDSGAARPVQILPTNLTHNIIGTDFNEAFDGETAAANGVTGAFSFDGQGGDDHAWGGEAGDTFTGGAGNEALFGNGGADTAVYAGPRADYTIVYTTDSNGVVTGFTSVTDTNSAGLDEGTDTLTSIERLQFADATLDLGQRVQLFDGGGNLVGTFNDIQAAINAASDGYRIEAQAGTYNESLNVNKDVTIEGANSGTAGTGTRGLETIVTGQIVIAADGVTINGVEITGDGLGPLGTTGVVVNSGSDNFSLVNSVLSGTGDFAIFVGGVTGLDVGHNLIEGYSIGMYIATGGTAGSVHDNRFQGDGGGATGLGNGVNSETTHVTITGNVFDGIYAGSLNLFPFGPDSIDLDSYISGNTITDSGAARPVQIMPTNLTHNIIGTDFNEAFDGETAAANGVTGAFSFDGQGGDDHAWGGGENDTFTGGAGNDRLIGNAGDDNAIYSGNRSDYTVILFSPGVVQITDNRPGSPDGTDQIEGVERVVFANNDYWVEPNGTLTVINDAPLGIDHSLTIDEDVVHAFSVADFSFTDTEGNQLLEVTITGLPTAGTIYYDADGAGMGAPVAIVAGATFTAADLNAGRLTYVPGSNANGLGYATFTYQVRDDGGTAHGGADTDPDPNTITIDVNAVNDEPSGADNAITFFEDVPYALAAADFGFSDPVEGDDFAGVVITNLLGGGVLLLDGDPVTAGQFVSADDIDAGLLVFAPAHNENGTSYASFDFQVRDDGGTDHGGVDTDQTANTITFNVTPVNDEPTLAATAANPTFIEDAAAADLFSAVTASTVETGQNFTSLTLTVTNVTDGASEILRFDGTDVALVDGSTGPTATNGLTVTVSVSGSTATVSFSGASLSAAQVQTLVDALSYRNASQAPTDADRVVTITQLVDSGSNVAPDDNVATLTVASTVNVEPVNDAPTSTLLANDTRTYVEGSAPVTLDVLGNATISDVDSPNFAGGSLTLTIADSLFEDDLLIINTAIVTTSGANILVNGTTIGTFSGGGGGDPLIISFNTNATPAAVQLFVRAIGYTNGGGDIPNGGLRTIVWALNDGDGNALGGNPNLSFTTRVSVLPVNDPPAGADVTVGIDEDEVYHFSTADFAFFDVEGDQPFGVRIESAPANGSLFFDPDGNGPNAAFEASPGMTIVWSDIQAGKFYYVPDADGNGIGFDSFTFAVVDSGGAADTSPNLFTFDVAPVNDAAVITGDFAGDVTEAGGVANATPGDADDSGDLDATDVDNTADAWQIVAPGTASIGGYGTYALTAAGVWTYIVDDSDAAVQALNSTATLTDTFNALTEDGTSQTVTITIHAQNDAAVVTGDFTGDVTEAGGLNNGTPGDADDTGDLDSTDVDNTADAWQVVAAGTASIGGYGTYALTAAGVWTYIVDDSDAAVQALNDTATLTDTFSALTADGTSQTVTITIHAQNDAAIITGDASGAVTEAGGTANGTAGDASDTGDLDATDVDNTADAWQVVSAGTASIGGYGTYALTAAGVWTYTVDDSDAAVQALNGAATLTDTFNALTEDGTSQTVTITIHAQNDAPTIDNLAGDTVAYIEGAAAVRLDAGLNAAVGDVDAGDFAAVSVGTVPGHPLDIAAIPDGSGRIFVVEYEGRIRILDPNTGVTDPTPFLDVSAEVLLAGESGLLGFAVAPDFATSGVFYVFMTNLAGDNEVRRYQTLGGDPDQADPGTMDVILVIPHSTDVHNGGWLGFGPDGYLYVSTGDGGSNPFDAQDPDSLNGKILRLDVSQDDFADPLRDYSIPLDNPFASGGGLGEIWALGLRNPYRNSFDPVTGNLYIGDVGAAQAEEINLMRPTDGGANFGWPVREGTLELNGPDSPAFTPPVAQYLHTGGITSVLGGYVYHGPIATLQNQYIFADIYGQSLALQGTLWSVPANSLVVGSTLGSAQFTLRTAAFAPDEGMNGLITGMGLDEAGNLYLADWHAGRIVRIEGGADPNFAGGRLAVAISQNKVAGEDRLQIDTSGTTITLSDGTNVGSEIRVGGVLIGFIAAGGTGVGADDLIIDFTGGATLPRIDTLIHSLSYLNTNGADPSTATRTITYTLTDGGGTEGVPNSVTFNSTVTVEGVNDEPVLTATGGNPTYVENAAAVDLFGTVAASTVESGQTFTSLTLTVTNVTDGASEILRVDGSDVALTNGNSVAGTATNGLTVNVTVVGTTATVTFAGATLSAAQLQTLVDALSYRNTSEDPTDGDRAVTITELVDSGSNAAPNDNVATLAIASTVNVNPVNDDALITGDDSGDVTEAGGTANGTPGDASDTGDLDAADVDGNADVWQAVAPGTASIGGYGSYALSAAGVWTYTLDDGDPDVQALNGAATLTDTFAALAEDGTPHIVTITINAQNDAPVVDLNGAGAGTSTTLAYTENDPVVAIAPAAVASDVDNPNFDEGRLRITITNGINGEDLLSIPNQGSGPGQIGYSNGVVTYEGVQIGILLPSIGAPFPVLDIDLEGANVSLAAVQALIRAISYQNLSDDPTVTARTVEFSLQDPGVPGALTTLATATINLTAVDDAPVAQPDAFTTDEATAIAGSVFVPNGSGPDTDPDGPPITVSAVNGSGANVGVQITLASGALLTLNADGTFTYNPNGAFNATPTPGSGASNQPQPDSFTYTLAGGNTTTVDLTIIGLDTNDTLLGTAGADTLIAGVGNDYLDPGAGADTMSGGTGNDIYWVDNAGDVVNEAAGEGHDTVFARVSYALTAGSEVEVLAAGTGNAIDLLGNDLANAIYGNDAANVLLGFGGSDVLAGFGGSDYLDGGTGGDGMSGGAGDDLYWVDSFSDSVNEAAGEDYDTVYARSSYALTQGSHVEVLAAGTAGAIDLFGNDLANAIYGNEAANVLLGGGGNDVLAGFGGNDYLDGEAGGDGMSGGAGDDLYWVDSNSDSVNEAVGEGQDTVFARVSYALTQGSHVEVLAAGVAGALNLTGNDLANAVYGNNDANVLLGAGGNDVLAGFGGNDYLDGGTGGDGMSGGMGDDTYWVDGFSDSVNEAAGEGQDSVYARASYALTQGAEVEVLAAGVAGAIDLTGNDLANQIYGNESANSLLGAGGSDVLAGFGGNDYIDGGTGADVMSGGTGDDILWVDNAGDVVNEAVGEGQDTVYARASYTLTAGSDVEVLAAGVAGALDLTGNALANQIYGNNDANVLNGGRGNDILGGFGGADTYAFTTTLAGNVDRVLGFQTGVDKIALDDAIFNGLTPGALAPGAFVIGSAAADADDRIIYNSATGALLFDADGNGAGAAVQFAILDGAPTLAASDFLVI